MKSLFLSRSFLFLWFAQFASGLGNTFSVFILSWILYSLTNSASIIGLFWFIFMVSSLLSQLISGPFLDKINYKMVMIFSNLGRSITFIAPIIFIYLGNLNQTLLFIIAILIGFLEPIFRPASMAMVAKMVDKELLLKANSLLEGTMQITMLIGPILGGVLVSIASPISVLIILVFSLFISSVLLMFIPSNKVKIITDKPSKFNWLTDFREGLSFYKTNTLFLWLGVIIFATNFSAGAIQPLLLPYVIEHLGGSSFEYGLMTSAIALGMILGSFISGIIIKDTALKNYMLGSLLLGGATIIGLGFSSTFSVALIFVMFNGFFIIIFNVNNTTLYQKKVPADLRGRVFSIRLLLSKISLPFGAAMSGLLIQTMDYHLLFVLLGFISIFPVVIAWFLPAFAQLNVTEKDIA